MPAMRLFIDTHDTSRGTFPEGMTEEAFAAFYPKYEQACRSVGAVSLRAHVGAAAGRAFCMTLAPNEDTVRRAHELVGLRYDSITEVVTASLDALTVCHPSESEDHSR